MTPHPILAIAALAMTVLLGAAPASAQDNTPQPVCEQKVVSHKLTTGASSATATFTVGENCSVVISLASYKMPGSSFDPSTVHLQKLFDSATGEFGPGQHTLTVSVPNCFAQVDLVHGPVLAVPTYAGRILATDIVGNNNCYPPPPPPETTTTTTTHPETTTTTVETPTTTTLPEVTVEVPPLVVEQSPIVTEPAPVPIAPIAVTIPPMTELPYTGTNLKLALLGGFLGFAGMFLLIEAGRRKNRQF